MSGHWVRTLVIVVAVGGLSACEVPTPPEEPAAVAPKAKKPAAVTPVVKKKPAPVIDFDDGGSGGGGWG